MTGRRWATIGTPVAALVLACAVLAGGAGASHNSYQQVSLGPAGGNGAFTTQWLDGSADGTRVLIRTLEPLVAGDTDGQWDLYERAADGTTTLVSPGLIDTPAFYGGASADFGEIVFETWAELVPADNDDCEPADPAENPCQDVYQYANGTTTLLSTGPVGGNGDDAANFEDISEDGARVLFTTSEPLVAGDTDSKADIYVRARRLDDTALHGHRGRQRRASSRSIAASSADGMHVFFTTTEQLRRRRHRQLRRRVRAVRRHHDTGVGRAGGRQRSPRCVVPRCVERRHQGVHRDGGVAGRRRHGQRDRRVRAGGRHHHAGLDRARPEATAPRTRC